VHGVERLAERSNALGLPGELVGPFKDGGRELSPAGQPEQVKVHDFIDKDLGKANPYGVYDIAADMGVGMVGTDHHTAQLAVATIERWWTNVGADRYPTATGLLISADGGGSNGSRTRLFKTELAAMATRTGLTITVCHLPPGTSKWNKIEHGLFSHISMNWRGRPLTSHEAIVNTIAATKTASGLRVHAELDTNTYATGRKIPDDEIKALEAGGSTDQTHQRIPHTRSLHRHGDAHPRRPVPGTAKPPMKPAGGPEVFGRPDGRVLGQCATGIVLGQSESRVLLPPSLGDQSGSNGRCRRLD
jgi:Rhodopirellula transposase DDE domain